MASEYMADFRRRVAKRREVRDQAAIEGYRSDAQRAQADRTVRSQRKRFIDSLPGLTIDQRADLRFSSQARANAHKILSPNHAARLREFEDTLASGARSVEDYRRQSQESQQRQYVVDATPGMLRSEIAQGNAKAKADNALADTRSAEAAATIASTPAKIKSMEADTLLKQMGSKGVAAGELVPPGFDETSRPSPMNDLDRARAANLDADTTRIFETIKQHKASGNTTAMAEIYERMLSRESDATPSQKKHAREQLLAIAAQMRRDGDIAESAIRQAQTQTGELVYEVSPGVWVYEDGAPYVDPEAEMEKLRQGF